MDFTPFYNFYRSRIPDSEQFETFVKNANEVFGNSDSRFAEQKSIEKLFKGSISNGNISKSQFFKNRKYTIMLYEWLLDGDKVSESVLDYVKSLTIDDIMSGEELRRYYFKDLESALSYLTSIAQAMDIKVEAVLPYQVITLLAWHRIEAAEMVEIQKSDVVDNVIFVKSGEHQRRVLFHPDYFRLITKYMDSETYVGFPGESTLKFANSVQLLRTKRAPHLTANNLYAMLFLFNRNIAGFGKLLNCTSLLENGMYFEILKQDSDEQSINQLIMSYMHCDKSMASWHKKKYLRWKREFYE